MTKKKILDLELKTEQRSFTIVYDDFLESNVLDKNEKLVFIALKRYANNKMKCYPSYSTIAKITGISKKTVISVIKQLEKKKVIKITKKSKDKVNKNNTYTIYDYAEMWKAGSTEQRKEIIKEKELEAAIDIIRAAGFEVTKKELVKNARQSIETSPKQQKNNVNIDNKTNINKSQESYTLDYIKKIYEYDIMIQEKPLETESINNIINILYDALNTQKESIKVINTEKPAAIVKSKLLKLNFNDILYVIENYSKQTQRIINPKAYILSMLYQAKEQYNLDITNKVNCDMNK